MFERDAREFQSCHSLQHSLLELQLTHIFLNRTQVRGAKSVTSAEFDAHNSVYHTAEMKGKGSNALSYRTLIPAHYKSNGMQRSGKSRKTGVGLTLYWFLARSSHFVRKPGHVVADRAVSSLEPTRRVDRARAMARGEDMFKWEPDAVSVMLSKPPKLEMVKLPSPESDEVEQEDENEDTKTSNKNFLSHCEELKRYGDLVRREDELVEKLLHVFPFRIFPRNGVAVKCTLDGLSLERFNRTWSCGRGQETRTIVFWSTKLQRIDTRLRRSFESSYSCSNALACLQAWKKVPKKRRLTNRYASADSNRSRRSSKRRRNASDSSEDNE